MKKVFSLLCALLISAAMFAQADAKPTFAVGEVAPEIAMPTLKGDIVKLSDMKGKFVVVDFWASWCGDCRRETPAMVELYKEYHPKGVEFLGVSFDTEAEKMTAAVEKYQIPWTQVTELKKWKETEIDKVYKLSWIPAFYIICPEGKVAGFGVTADAVKEALAKLVK